MIKQTQDELGWRERTWSWMNDNPAGDLGSKRKLFEDLHNTNKPSTQVLSSKRWCPLATSKRMVDEIEDVANATKQIPN